MALELTLSGRDGGTGTLAMSGDGTKRTNVRVDIRSDKTPETVAMLREVVDYLLESPSTSTPWQRTRDAIMAMRAESPDLMDGGVTAVVVEQEAGKPSPELLESALAAALADGQALTKERDEALARAEKAEQERDVLAERVRDFADSIRREQATNDRLRAEQSRGFTPADITDEMVERGRSGYWGEAQTGCVEDVVRTVLIAALTPPPATPDWQSESAERIRGAVWGVELPNEAGATGTFLAARLARHGYKVVPLSEQDEAELEGGQR